MKEGVVIVIWIMDHPAMYHRGYMAALNLTWFKANSGFSSIPR